MSSRSQPAGCRRAAIATGLLVGVALVFTAVGLTLVNRGACEGGCETLGLTLLYAGLPVSALLGVFFGGLVVAWPLDITVWVSIGFFLARRDRDRTVAASVTLVIALALVYGLVLSRFVEMVI